MSAEIYVNRQWVIDWEDLQDLLPNETKALEELPLWEWADLAEDIEEGWALSNGNLLEYPENTATYETIEEHAPDEAVSLTLDIFAKTRQLIEAFKAKTGLTLSAMGCKYVPANDAPDNIEGCVFTVDGMTSLTPEGEKMQGIVTDQTWAYIY